MKGVISCQHFDAIERLLLQGHSVNAVARMLGMSACPVFKCIRARPHLANIAHENGKRAQRISKYKPKS